MLDLDERELMPLTLDEYEADALEHAIYDDDLIYLTGLVSEAGEVADKFKKLLRDEQFELPFDDVAVTMTYEERYEAQELGDAVVRDTPANDLNFSPEEIAEANLHKLEGSKRGTIRGPATTARCVWS